MRDTYEFEFTLHKDGEEVLVISGTTVNGDQAELSWDSFGSQLGVHVPGSRDIRFMRAPIERKTV